MKQKILIKRLILAAAVALGLVSFASAQSANVSPHNPAAPSAPGLLGQTYAGVTFDYLHLENGPPSAGRGFTFTYNQPLNYGFDATFDYQRMRSSAFGHDYTTHKLDTSLTAFTTNAPWGKPYITAGIGEEWRRGGGASDNSFTFLIGTGIEFRLVAPITLTPYMDFTRATQFSQNAWEYGMKASYQITDRCALLARIQYSDLTHSSHNTTEYSLGVNFRF
ncbi:MAG: outer membrane beta-barrel protein [Opitutaceae bacterium]|nr:outer membrane beta-barrel protein [Opitutaceae bacterium]